MRSIALTVLLATLASCSSSTASRDRGALDEMQDARMIDTWFAEIQAEEASLTSALGRAPVDCPRACDLRASITNLARRICALAERPEADRERQVQCVDARRRSEISRANVKSVCECGK